MNRSVEINTRIQDDVKVEKLRINVRKRHRSVLCSVGTPTAITRKSRININRYIASERVRKMKRKPVDVRERVFDKNVIKLQMCPIKPSGAVNK
jgi:hypothetical protein